MKKIFVLLLLFSFAACINQLYAQKDERFAISGRWDITMDVNGKSYPSWLEVIASGNNKLVGRFVGTSGSARPVSRINFSDGKMNFSIPPQWEDGQDMALEATLNDDKLTGTITSPNGKTHNFTALRALALKRDSPPVWGSPITLFNGMDTKGWHALGENQWIVENGVLKSPHSGANLVTDETFNDFKLHIEFRYPKGSNSGVYLRGRYEVQVEDGAEGAEPVYDQFSAVYGFLEPSKNMAKDAGEWQAYDITLVGRMVTVVANGETVICNAEIPGITGGAINSNEGEPGPLLIQGDHGPIEYRNIIITPAK